VISERDEPVVARAVRFNAEQFGVAASVIQFDIHITNRFAQNNRRQQRKIFLVFSQTCPTCRLVTSEGMGLFLASLHKLVQHPGALLLTVLKKKRGNSQNMSR
jgi:hypothetical protein